MKKQERQARAEEIIDCYEIGELFSNEHLNEFKELTGITFDWIKRVHLPMYAAARHLECSCEEWGDGGYEGTFSWRQAIKQLSDKKYNEAKLNNTMRESLRFFQKDWLNRQDRICVNCGATENLQADHKDPPFKEIQKSFIEKFGEPSLEKGHEVGWRLSNAQPWLDYHNSIATYQVLCRSCNASKGAR